MKEVHATVSVIIPCYRCNTTIERAFLSVLHQTMVPGEIILVEDCSGDGGRTVAELTRLKKEYQDIPIKVLQLEKNRGPAAARNAGWAMAQQPYIAFLDADDAWHPKKIEIQYTWMKLHPEVVLSCHRSTHLRFNSDVPELTHFINFRPISRRLLLLSNKIATRSVMVKRDIPYRFEEEKKYGEDYHLWLRIVLNGSPAWYLDMPLCYSYESDQRGKNLSADLWQMEKGELDVHKRLFHDNLISRSSLFVLSSISLGKYVRRVIAKSISKKHF